MAGETIFLHSNELCHVSWIVRPVPWRPFEESVWQKLEKCQMIKHDLLLDRGWQNLTLTIPMLREIEKME